MGLPVSQSTADASQLPDNAPGPWDPLATLPERSRYYRVGLTLLTTVALACACMLGVGMLPFQDPVDVVGVPLTTGYSERSEQMAFYAFLAVSLAGSFVCWPLWQCCPDRLVCGIGAAVLWCALIRALPTAWYPLLLLLEMSALGWISFRLRSCGPDRLLPLWLISVYLWGWTYEQGRNSLGNPPTLFVFLVLSVTFLIVMARLFRPGMLDRVWPYIWLGTAGVEVAIHAWHTSNEAHMVVLGAFVFLVACHGQALRELWDRARRRPWLWALGLLAVCSFQRPDLMNRWQCFWSALNGALIGLSLSMAGCDPRFSINPVQLWDRTGLPWILLLFVPVVAQVWRPPLWFGSVLFGALLWLLLLPRPLRHRARMGTVLTLLLVLMGLPRIFWSNFVDTFHDGQILSAVWEFEAGRQLFEEVFPLRTAEFFLAWIARKIFPPTLAGSTVFFQFAPPLCMAGAGLAAYAWTRFPLWSLATGLLVCPWFSEYFCGIREGLLLLFMGIAAELLRQPDWRCWLPLIPLGVLSCFGGFDMLTAFVPPLGAALLLAPGSRFGGRRRNPWRAGPVVAAVWGVMPLMLFTLIVAVWQGKAAAQAFWSIFFDFSRNYNAFYGLPFYVLRREIPYLVLGLGALGLFAAGGALAWPTMTSSRRRTWLFLLLSTFMFCHRALGRSDFTHVTSPFASLLLLWSLILFEATRRLSRAGDPARFSLLGLALVCFLSPEGRWKASSPRQLAVDLMSLPKEEMDALRPNPALQALVPPDEYLWPVENGIANYINQRYNPTRHAIAYCIGSPAEQRRAAADLKRHKTPVIDWEFSPINGIDGLVRYYIMTPFVLRHYRPLEAGVVPGPRHYAVLADPDWGGLIDLPEGFAAAQYQGRLPLTWGRARWPTLADRITRQETLPDWKPQEQPDAPGWETRDEINPRNFNYLLLEFSASAPPPRRGRPVQATLAFTPGEYDAESAITFELAADGRHHRYLIPIGCHPGWTWRPVIRGIRLTVAPDCAVMQPAATLCEVDEESIAGP